MIYSFKFRFIHIIVGQQSRTFRRVLLNRACAQPVYTLSSLLVTPPEERRVLTQPILGWRPSPLKGLWEETSTQLVFIQTPGCRLPPSISLTWADASCIIDSLPGHVREGEHRHAHVAAKGDNMTSCLWLWRKRHKHNQTHWGWPWKRRLFRVGDRTCFLTSVTVRSRAAWLTLPFTPRPWER